MQARTGEPTGHGTAHAGRRLFLVPGSGLEQLQGVQRVESGYAGGSTPNPTYRDVCSGRTGHAEVVQVTFDPAVVSYQEVLDVFFAVHDPTTLNRQGPDVGTQYRSAVFYHSPAQKTDRRAPHRRAERPADLAAAHRHGGGTAGALLPGGGLPPGYFRANPAQGYCQGGGSAEGWRSSASSSRPR